MWILHDINTRDMYIYNLMELIDITGLTKESLLKYIYKKAGNHSAIIKDIEYCYYNQIENKNHKLLLQDLFGLICVGKLDGELHVQRYNSILKQWYQPRKIIDRYLSSAIQNGTILNNIFYYLVIDNSCPKNVQLNLASFNLLTEQNTVLRSSEQLLRCSAMCASQKFLYLCGGQRKDGSVSNQVVRFNPRKNSFKMLTQMPTKRYNATAIFDEGYLYVIGGRNKSAELVDAVEMYDAGTKKWSKLAPLNPPRVGFGVSVLDNNLYIAGGLKYSKGQRKYCRSVKVYNPLSER
ncbi:kelch-like protein diablo [Phymastichus coffea]|uniref:kelch-like protein diablo n=1 Tax=Phymastichus coffea TaxID=108790 RepID=UPI00273BAEE3|nr:kelch-like protein diablo [Phymastichus coffea]